MIGNRYGEGGGEGKERGGKGCVQVGKAKGSEESGEEAIAVCLIYGLRVW